MTKKNSQMTNEPGDSVIIPALTVKKAHRVLMSPVRMPAELVAQAYTIMNRENWTPTEFTEKAWRLLIESATPPQPESPIRSISRKLVEANNKPKKKQITQTLKG